MWRRCEFMCEVEERVLRVCLLAVVNDRLSDVDNNAVFLYSLMFSVVFSFVAATMLISTMYDLYVTFHSKGECSQWRARVI